jgi:hypothetical protein
MRYLYHMELQNVAQILIFKYIHILDALLLEVQMKSTGSYTVCLFVTDVKLARKCNYKYCT